MCRVFLIGVGPFFRGGLHLVEYSGSEDLGASEYRTGRGHGRGDFLFFLAAAHYIFGHPHDDLDFFLRPFYDRHLWNTKAVLGGTSIAVLTYIGFDGISTLSEEAENPRRNILLATVLTCLVIGILSAVEVYAGQLIWPAYAAISQR